MTTMTCTPTGAIEHDLSVFPERLRGKRILLCTESFGPVNGVSRTTLMLVNHLRANGANVAVVAPHNHTKVNTFVPATETSTSASIANESCCSPNVNPEVRVHGYPLPFNPELSIVYPVRLSSLYARTFGDDSPPDLIYLASPASLGFQVMLQVRQQPVERQVPVLANFQTDLAGYCAILFSPPFSDLAVYTFSQVEGFLFRHPSVQTIFYPSRFVRRYLERNGVRSDKMQLLRRGVNTTLFHPDRRSASLRQRLQQPRGDEIVLVCVARMAGEKGFDFLAKTASELDRRGVHFTLYVVGGNRSAAVEAEIKGLFADDLRRRGRVVFAGFQTGEVLAEAYASADIFLHCSVTETFGLVVLESMASGVPVVARDEGGPSDIVVDGVSGYLVPPNDLSGFVDKVQQVAADPVLRHRLAANARVQACAATWDKINNTVAWRMVDAMDARAAAQKAREASAYATDSFVAEAQEPLLQTTRSKTTATTTTTETTPLLFPSSKLRRTASTSSASSSSSCGSSSSWEMWTQSLDTSLVDARLTAGLGVILGFWAVVGVYLVFIKAALWVKGRMRLAV